MVSGSKSGLPNCAGLFCEYNSVNDGALNARPYKNLAVRLYSAAQTNASRGLTVLPTSEYSSYLTPAVSSQSSANFHSSCSEK